MTFAPVFQRPLNATFDRRAAAAASNGLLNALIAYWPGNEASGNLLDAHSNALHLTDMNTVTNAAGKVYSTARQYTRANSEYHTRPGDDALLSTGDVDFTLAAWMWLDSNTFASTIGKYNTVAADREYSINFDALSNRIRFLVSQTGATATVLIASTFGAPPTGAWIWVVCWHDSVADTINIQINNGTVDSQAYSVGVNNGAQPFMVGSYNAGAPDTHFDGRIGPVAFWKSAAGGGGVLSSSQRTALYNGGAGLAYAAFTT